MKYTYFLASIAYIFPIIVAKQINGTKLLNLINCFAPYESDLAHRPDNSNTKACKSEDILYCRTDSGNNDHFCKFDGTNILQDWFIQPKCWYNCQMETCNAWTIAHNKDQEKCIRDLYS